MGQVATLHSYVPGSPGTAWVGLFGPLQAVRMDGGRVTAGEFRTGKTRHLLRLLALQAERPVRADWLVEVLWPHSPIGRGRASLRTAACQLRRTLGGDHVARHGGSLVLHGVEVDVHHFQRDADTALQCFAHRDLDLGLIHARAALASFRGEFAEDEPYLDPILQARDWYAMRREQLLVEAATAALQLGHLDAAAEFASSVFREDPSSERACRTLIRAYVGLGERSMALRVYERCRRAMAEELGVTPDCQTQDLYRQLLADVSQELNVLAPSTAYAS
jgi:SARP family transcriptional regulator, regulator of embCAB operon